MTELVAFLLICIGVLFFAVTVVSIIIELSIFFVYYVYCLFSMITNTHQKLRHKRKYREYVKALSNEAIYYRELNGESNKKRREVYEELTAPLYEALRAIES